MVLVGPNANVVGTLELRDSVQLKEGLPDAPRYAHMCFEIIETKIEH